MNPYHYATLRYVHDLATGEFVNVGIGLWLPETRAFIVRTNQRYGRLSGFFEDFDGTAFRQQLRQVDRRASQLHRRHPQEELRLDAPTSIEEALERVVHPEDRCFQWSPIRTGIAEAPLQRIDSLFKELVEQGGARAGRDRKDESAIQSFIDSSLVDCGLSERLDYDIQIRSDRYAYRFHAGWRNGVQQVLEPISLDYLNPSEIVEKANTWGGRLYALAQEEDFRFVGIVAPPEAPGLADAYHQALAILVAAPHVRRIASEEQIDEVLRDIEADLAIHE